MTDKSQAPTPMIAQYREIKAEHEDFLLFFRMGDFYELFFEDAVTASKALDIALTKRGRFEGKEIDMCGVPYHAYENYLSRLIRQGFKVAICEQMEDPVEAKKRGSKSVVKREVIRLVTAGTLTEDHLLDSKKNNFMLGISRQYGILGFAWLDISTGDFFTSSFDIKEKKEATILSNMLSRLSPVEIIVSDSFLHAPENFPILNEYRDKISVLPMARFNSDNAYKKIKELYKVETLDAFGQFTRPEITAAGVLLDYVENSQKGKAPYLSYPVKIYEHQVLEIDAATRRNLELTESTAGEKENSLLSVIDKTITGAGGRLLSFNLSNPVVDIKEINNRLDVISFFVDNQTVLESLRNQLKLCPDLERALKRLMLGRGGPRDLAVVKNSLYLVPYIKNIINSAEGLNIPDAVTALANRFGEHSGLVDKLSRALKKDLPLLARDGDFIEKDYCPPLDEIRQIKEDSHSIIVNLQNKYAEQTGINQLKIKFNNVIGYFIEVPSRFAQEMFEDKTFIHRQSVLNAARFTTVELTDLEAKIRGAAEKILAMELQIFNDLVQEIVLYADDIIRSAKAIAELDVGSALAYLAISQNYCRPKMDATTRFDVKGGRHPVVEHSLKRDHAGEFVNNNCHLNDENSMLWLITGPNMAGKSTFLRQNAIIAIMAHMGSYVPAESAHIGLIDKIFSRVGASDELARGRSTFMVEMVETAGILNQATEKSFVILDEIGRGTATFDGLSIAWAVVEHLHEKNKCRALFATHYHELTSLVNKLGKMSLHCMKIKEFNDEVIFLHEVIDGAADRSYGIHVAKLAGLPDVVVRRAEQVLDNLEKDNKSININALTDDLPLFSNMLNADRTQSHMNFKVEEIQVIESIEAIYPDELTPKQALEKLYEIKSLLHKT